MKKKNRLKKIQGTMIKEIGRVTSDMTNSQA